MRHPQGGDRRPWRFGLFAALLVLAVMAAVVSAAAAKPTATGATVKVGLITKDATNPFFVKMHAGANAAAKKAGAELIYAAGKDSSDNAGQITAIENMVTAGVKGILITVADAKAENAAIAQAMKGVLVIALDSRPAPRLRSTRVRHEHFNAGVHR
jgi:fructose transport system substrate-binding protein